MTDKDKAEITRIAKEFSEPFYEMTGGINGSGWIIVDPLSAYLNFCGYQNKLFQMPESVYHPLVLIIMFKDGTQFIPAAGDLKLLAKDFENWQWI